MKVINLNEAKLTPQQLLDRFYEYNGFNKDGEGWIVCGETYSIKDDLKKLGGKFNGEIKHWIIPVNDPAYTTIWVRADILFERNPSTGILDYRYPVYPPNSGLMTQVNAADNELKQQAQAQAKQQAQDAGITSQYVGKVGDKINIDIKSIELKGTFPSQYGGEGGIYEIIDIDGNYYVWYSSSVFRDVSKVKSVAGTIKGYKEYNGVEQTVLTRCKFSNTPGSIARPKQALTRQPAEQAPEDPVKQEEPVEEMPTFDMSLFN